ncbi:MAG: Fis family transcriptional regulator [Candidatus Aminicenantes bacterium RBG_16_63_16]|nr:MAG: Fis family transcriptional regulator [Candidatus Aminicenantes bacterium RBG_16_63_16]
MSRILVVDDDPLVSKSIAQAAQRFGHQAVSAPNIAGAMTHIRDEPFDLVMCDVRLPDGSGLDILPDLKNSPSQPEVIIMTGFGDPDGAELAIKNGAWDYLQKPLSLKDLALTLERALEYREKKQAARKTVALKRQGIVGNSPALRACLDVLAQASTSDANVLITGETGTGKELFAWAIHENSARSDRNFVVVDCAALPETLVESTLFGHVRGAFTGADKARDGLTKQADGGTLFLDEIGELSLSIQKAFLRVLQERRFRPVGGSQEVSSDFRLIAATNRDIEGLARKEAFREDLLYRLRTLSLDLPPLRDCREDIKDLSLHYVAKFCAQYDVPMKGFSSDFFDALDEYDWPGNVRELIQALEKAVVTAKDEPVLYPKHLPQHVRIHIARAALEPKSPEEPGDTGKVMGADELPTLEKAREAGLARIEREYLVQLNKSTNGDIKEACRISGLSRSRLYALYNKHYILPTR